MMQSSHWVLLQQEIDQLLQARSPRTQQRVRQLVAQCNSCVSEQLPPLRPSQPTLLCGGMIQQQAEVVWCLDEWKCAAPSFSDRYQAGLVALGCFDGTCSVVALHGSLPQDVTSVTGPSAVVASLVTPGRAAVVSLACAQRRAAAVVGCGDGRVYLWCLSDEQPRHAPCPDSAPSPMGASQRSEDLLRYLATATPTGAAQRRSMSIESMIIDDDADVAAGSFGSRSDLSSFDDESKNSSSSLADLDEDGSPNPAADSRSIRATPVRHIHGPEISTDGNKFEHLHQTRRCATLLSSPRDCCTAVAWLDSDDAIYCGMRSGNVLRIDASLHGAGIDSEGGYSHRLVQFRTVDAGRAHGPVSKISFSPHAHPSSQLVCVGTAAGTVLLADVRAPTSSLVVPAVALPAKSAGRCVRDITFSTTSDVVFWTGGDERLLKSWDLRKLATATSSKEKGHAIRSIAHIPPQAAARGDDSGGWLVITEADDLVSVSSVTGAGHGGVATTPALEFKNLHKRTMLAGSCTVRRPAAGTASVVTGSIGGLVSELVIHV